jgi:uncharacterized protein
VYSGEFKIWEHLVFLHAIATWARFIQQQNYSIQMKEDGIISGMHPWLRLLLLLILSFTGLLVATVAGVLIMVPFWGMEFLEAVLGQNGATIMDRINYARLMQILTHFGLFIIPSLAFAWLICTRPFKYLQADKSPKGNILFMSILLMLAALPLVSLLMEINLRLTLPDVLAPVEDWMRRAEEGAGELTKVFLHVDTIQGLLFNLFMIAVIPAIGEEFLFRSILIKNLRSWGASGHLAVWISAVIFSAIHMQFFGFLPRLFLGALLGYMFLWTGNIWVPIVAHFFNNAMAVIMYFLLFNKMTTLDLEQLRTQHAFDPSALWIYALSAVSVVFLFFLIKRETTPQIKF